MLRLIDIPITQVLLYCEFSDGPDRGIYVGTSFISGKHIDKSRRRITKRNEPLPLFHICVVLHPTSHPSFFINNNYLPCYCELAGADAISS